MRKGRKEGRKEGPTKASISLPQSRSSIICIEVAEPLYVVEAAFKAKDLFLPDDPHCGPLLLGTRWLQPLVGTPTRSGPWTVIKVLTLVVHRPNPDGRADTPGSLRIWREKWIASLNRRREVFWQRKTRKCFSRFDEKVDVVSDQRKFC